ncbi:UNKNOWN [Stylonychia lemnae]|uniref:Uncharacterized protein n=1 Tax=Stylonychia lemnae TaxID=5949 RepID=A0A078B5N5_STYLE|nr:UNKNOWN [Stylonychia lemnae]|eukprot:CDW88617.1 UNKNOWN [Stylonychia lemnae]
MNSHTNQQQQNQQQNTIQGSSKDFQGESMHSNQQNKQDPYDYQVDLGSIGGMQAQRSRANGQSENYNVHVQGDNNNYQSSMMENKKDELKSKQLIMVDRNVAHKRRSIENKDAIMAGSRPRELVSSVEFSTQNRQLIQGAKSAMSNYGSTTTATQGQTATNAQNVINNQNIKQINKNAKVERDPVMEQSQQQFQPGKQRSLAKSQSQNKLMLVSQEALMNKNNMMMQYQDIIYSQAEGGSNGQHQAQDKNSFYKDPVTGQNNNQIQDLLYKQHMQYSATGAMQGAQKGWRLKIINHNSLLSKMTSNTDCTLCNKTVAGGMISLSVLPNQCSALYCSKDDHHGMLIQNHLSKKYSSNREYYNLKIVNDLIYNENTHIVSIFKDYLILDDINEFLKRSYSQSETKGRLPKLCCFYEKYSQVFPNYVVLPESKYMFKNIQRKQKLIDEQYQLQEELAKKQHQTLLDEDKLFDTKFYNSYYSNMGDLSMSKKQYEDQAKQISVYAGKKQSTRIDQMKIEELVDRFLMKDSESNIQLLTSVALDFSGFTNSFINPSQHSMQRMSQEKTPNKSSQKPQNLQPISHTRANNQQAQTQLKHGSTKTLAQTGSTTNLNSNANNANTGGKKSLESSKKIQPQSSTGNLLTQNPNSQQPTKKQKNSFNNNQQTANQQQQKGAMPKLDSLKINQMPATNQDSNKNTPRIQKANAIANNILSNQDFNSQKPVIQTSPGTKEAIDNYLHNCNLDMQEELLLRSGQKMQIDPHFQTQKLNVGPLLSPSNQNANNLLESPQLKSPNGLNNINKNINQAGSSSSLLANQQHFQHSLNTNNNRQAMKSQCIIPTMQQITSMKKTTRLSNGNGNGGNSSSNIQASSINNNLNRQVNNNNNNNNNNQRKNISPMPVANNPQVQGTASRNQQVNTNSTQKSQKSQTTHTKYLSGGNDQYQKLLGLNPQTNINIQQNSYASNYDTLNSHLIQSSSKKANILHQQRSKQELAQDIPQGTIYSQASHQKQNQPAILQQPDFNDHADNEAVTGEDCDDFGIADERFASPDGGIVFQTIDDNMNPIITQGRKSLEGAGFTAGKQTQQQMLLLTSSEDKLFSQSNNYDQIKKHLEQYITINPQTTQGNQGPSLPSNHTMTFDAQSQISNSKKYSANNLQSIEKYDEVKQSINSATISSGSQGNYQQQNSQEQSRNNATGQKPFESMKQKIRGVYDGGNQNTEPPSVQSANKTPNKSSTHSKKSTAHLHAGSNNNIVSGQQNMGIQNNRMSIESNNFLMMAQNANNQGGVPLSSTSANGRQLSFSQTSFTNNANNYRSITNLQQRKGSNINTKELSIESKRLSGQHRQSFKDLSQQSQQQVQTTITDQNKIIKRSATGKNLNLQDGNAHSQTFGQFQSNFGSGNLSNPTFISQQNSNGKYQTAVQSHQQQNSANQLNALTQQQQQIQSAQAANTVRVMTPSYSLASLTKLISPTTTTSPLTMTVTVNGNNQAINRKQVVSKGKQSALGVHPQNYHPHNPAQQSNLTSSQSQNFLLSDKNSKLITSSTLSQKGIISSKASVKSSNMRQNNTASASQHPIQISNTISQKLGRHQISQQQNNQLSLQQVSQSQHTLQQTPRGAQLNPIGQLNQQIVVSQQQQIYENSQNLSCTVSTENNSSKSYKFIYIAAKAIESNKHPKFMRTIEEHSNSTTTNQGPTYNTMLSATLGNQRTGQTLANSISQAQLDTKSKQKIQTVVNSNQASIKRVSGNSQTLSQSASVSHFKSPSTQINSKKQLQGRYLHM